MNLEANKHIVRRLYAEYQDQMNEAVLPELMHSDVIVHDPFLGEQRGLEAYLQLSGVFFTGFPGHKTELELFIAENDLVTILHTHRAVHKGPFMGAAATGKPIEVQGLELYRLRDGKISEVWRFDADVSLMMQLGTMPTPKAA